jgi:hypothetical protein
MISSLPSWAAYDPSAPFATYKTPELTAALAPTSDMTRPDSMGNPIVDSAYAIPMFTSELDTTPTPVDIRTLAAILHIALALPAGGNAIPTTPEEYAKWLISIEMETPGTSDFLRATESSIRRSIKAPVAAEGRPLYIWWLAANGSDPAGPLLVPEDADYS